MRNFSGPPRPRHQYQPQTLRSPAHCATPNGFVFAFRPASFLTGPLSRTGSPSKPDGPSRPESAQKRPGPCRNKAFARVCPLPGIIAQELCARAAQGNAPQGLRPNGNMHRSNGAARRARWRPRGRSAEPQTAANNAAILTKSTGTSPRIWSLRDSDSTARATEARGAGTKRALL